MADHSRYTLADYGWYTLADSRWYSIARLLTAQALLIDQQLCVLWRRARTVRLAIALVASSALAAALLIIVLFFTAILRLEIAWLIAALFVVCMAGLISGLIAFIVDINLSLDALTLELKAVGFTKC